MNNNNNNNYYQLLVGWPSEWDEVMNRIERRKVEDSVPAVGHSITQLKTFMKYGYMPRIFPRTESVKIITFRCLIEGKRQKKESTCTKLEIHDAEFITRDDMMIYMNEARYWPKLDSIEFKESMNPSPLKEINITVDLQLDFEFRLKGIIHKIYPPNSRQSSVSNGERLLIIHDMYRGYGISTAEYGKPLRTLIDENHPEVSKLIDIRISSIVDRDEYSSVLLQSEKPPLSYSSVVFIDCHANSSPYHIYYERLLTDLAQLKNLYNIKHVEVLWCPKTSLYNNNNKSKVEVKSLNGKSSSCFIDNFTFREPDVVHFAVRYRFDFTETCDGSVNDIRTGIGIVNKRRDGAIASTESPTKKVKVGNR